MNIIQGFLPKLVENYIYVFKYDDKLKTSDSKSTYVLFVFNSYKLKCFHIEIENGMIHKKMFYTLTYVSLP